MGELDKIEGRLGAMEAANEVRFSGLSEDTTIIKAEIKELTKTVTQLVTASEVKDSARKTWTPFVLFIAGMFVALLVTAGFHQPAATTKDISMRLSEVEKRVESVIHTGGNRNVQLDK